MNILFVTDQPFLKAANQVIYQSVKMFVDKGDYVIILGSGDTGHAVDTQYNPEDVFGREYVRYHQYVSKFAKLTRLLRGLRKQKKQKTLLPGSDCVLSFEGTRSNWKLSDVRLYIQSRKIASLGNRVLRKQKIDLIFCLEIGASKACEYLSQRHRIPLVSKYMGTIAYPYLMGRREVEIGPYISAYQSNSLLHFMLNDGTKGDEVLNKLGVSNDKVRFRIDPVDLDKFQNLPVKNDDRLKLFGERFSETDILYLTLSNHNAQYKRLDRIIRAFNEASTSHSSLIIVGHGSFTEEYRALAQGNAKIIFMGKVAHDQIPSILNATDVYVNCNDESNLSHTVLEAMSAGKLLITLNDGSVDNLLQHQENALLVETKGIHEGMVATIEEVERSPDLINKLGCEAKRTAEAVLMTWDEKNSLEHSEILEKMESLC